MRKLVLIVALYLVPALPFNAQSFSSGSTGADGALDLSVMSCPGGICEVQLPESGILNYTTVFVPGGRTLIFKKNYRNTSVVILAQGTVGINGVVHLSALNREPGPGGYFGGNGATSSPGFGPGGGQPPAIGISCVGADYPASAVGKWIGSLSLVPIQGGSGGAATSGDHGGGGGGGIVIASSTSINVTGQINANAASGNNANGCGPAGSGGAIRLVANSVFVSGTLSASGKVGHSSTNGVNGIIRLEAPAGSLVFNGTATPLPVLSTTPNPQIVSDSNTPTLAITAIGGFPVSYTSGRPDAVDLVLPNQVNDPINILVQAHNIPVGTQVNLNISGSPSVSLTPGTLSGTFTSSTTTIGVTGLSRTGATYIIAYADFTLPANALRFNPKGPDEIAKVRVVAKFGHNSNLVFLRKNGTEIDRKKVPEAVLRIMGASSPR